MKEQEVPMYLVETYVSRARSAGLAGAAARARMAADDLARDGIPVRYLRFIFIPEDEVCFHLFEGPSAEHVRTATARAGLGFDRIVEAVSELSRRRARPDGG